jgi:hypothetical protein
MSDAPDLREFVRKQRHTAVGFVERKLWDLAELAPLGSMLMGSEVNPYLLRCYVSPREPQFRWLWEKIRARAEKIGQFDAALFKGVPHLYLHHFFRGDDDREMHNHPWEFSMSLILTGGYIEERWDIEARKVCTRRCYPGDINIIRAADFHRVTMLDPARGCWTLFLSKHRIEEKNGHDWGFLDTATGKYTPWGPFVSQRDAGAKASAGG